jgi:hypothetical protein
MSFRASMSAQSILPASVKLCLQDPFFLLAQPRVAEEDITFSAALISAPRGLRA